jgi:hypothetical protein
MFSAVLCVHVHNACAFQFAAAAALELTRSHVAVQRTSTVLYARGNTAQQRH